MTPPETPHILGLPDRKQAVYSPLNQVFMGDCLDIAPTLPLASFDLIYIDPPFFTNRDFSGKNRNSQNDQATPDTTLNFTDRWQGGLHEYLAWLETRIRTLKPLLKPTASFLLHLDWHAVHYAKVLCDQIFTIDNFQNELIWHYQTGGASKGRFSRKHDTLLLYSNSPTFYFNGPAIAIPRTPKSLKRAKCPTGARITISDTTKNPEDVLAIPALNPMATERTGYPTQKPLQLLTRLITALCPPHGTVGDFFCGSGTTLLAAKRLHRNYLGCDSNPDAITLTKSRLELV